MTVAELIKRLEAVAKHRPDLKVECDLRDDEEPKTFWLIDALGKRTQDYAAAKVLYITP